MNKPYKTAVSHGPRAFLGARTKPPFFYCFCTVHRINETYKPAGAHGFLSLFYSYAKSSATRGPRRVKNHTRYQVFNKSIRTYVSSVKNKSKFRKVHDASRDNIMCGLVCMKCRMRGRYTGRYTTWLSGASYVFPDLVM